MQHPLPQVVTTKCIPSGSPDAPPLIEASCEVVLSEAAQSGSRVVVTVTDSTADPSASAAPLARADSGAFAASSPGGFPPARATLALTPLGARPWSPSDPRLYELTVTLFAPAGPGGDEVELDCYSLSIGFRTIEARTGTAV